MDGNARWAARRGLSTFLGHQAGLQAFKRLLRLCNDWRVGRSLCCRDEK
jgi:undecaprenyl diphosphate synthase